MLETENLPHERESISIDDVHIPERLRKEYGDIDGLAQSISDKGLIQPIVLNRDAEGKYSLVAGGRRTAALRALGQQRLVYGIHYVTKDGLTPPQRLELELEENVQRMDMSWQERCDSIWKIHSLKKQVSLEKDEDWGHEETGALLDMKKSNVSAAIQVAKELASGNKEVAKADSLRSAINVLLKQKETAATSRLANLHVRSSVAELTESGALQTGLEADGEDPNELPSERMREEGVQRLQQLKSEFKDGKLIGENAKAPGEVVQISKMFLNMDCCAYLDSLPDNGLKATTITDPPFAIEMDNIQQQGGGMNVDSVRATHDVGENMIMLRHFIDLLYMKTEPGRYAVLFCDPERWNELKDMAVLSDWKVMRWPLVWCKMHQCQNMAAQFNFTKKTEFALVMRKGDATLVESAQSNYFECEGLSVKKEIGDHPFVKPFELWQWIASKVALKGSLVYDPFAGRNSGPIALLRAGYKVLANEVDAEHYNAGILHVADFYRKINPDIQFA